MDGLIDEKGGVQYAPCGVFPPRAEINLVQQPVLYVIPFHGLQDAEYLFVSCLRDGGLPAQADHEDVQGLLDEIDLVLPYDAAGAGRRVHVS